MCRTNIIVYSSTPMNIAQDNDHWTDDAPETVNVEFAREPDDATRPILVYNRVVIPQLDDTPKSKKDVVSDTVNRAQRSDAQGV